MTNPLQIKTRITVIKEKMKTILRNLSRSYESGDIKSPSELQHRVYKELQEFYDSIGKNTFKPVKAWGPPYSADHNGMIKQMRDDFMTLYAEVILMTSDLANNYEQVELERQSFLARLTKVDSLIKSIDGNIREADYTVVFRDNFVDYDQFQTGGTNLTPANLSADEGLLTLAKLESETFNEYATVTIIDGNGFPGNTHMVRAGDGTLKFDGQENMHINLADVLDGNGDTWFEYELFELTNSTRKTTLGMDYEYKEGMQWATVGGDLRCVMKIEFGKPKIMNWLSVSPFVPSDKGSIPALIEKIIVTDDKGSVSSMAFSEEFDSTKGYLFPRQSCKSIVLYLNQKIAYETMVGHFFFKQINTGDIVVMNKDNEQEGLRVHGPVTSVKNLGVAYDTGSQEILYPVVAYGERILDEDAKKSELFSVPATPTNVHAGLEQVSAHRYVIGMRDINMASYTFDKESEYVSTPFVSATPLSSIELDVNADIPAIFDADTDWLEYYVSTDDGQNWHPIFPRNIYRSEAKTKYLFNSGVPKEGRVDEVGYIESLTDIYQVQLRIVLRRPEDVKDAQFYTPIVYGYELHVTTAEELI